MPKTDPNITDAIKMLRAALRKAETWEVGFQRGTHSEPFSGNTWMCSGNATMTVTFKINGGVTHTEEDVLGGVRAREASHA